MSEELFYDYTSSKTYCGSIGLVWLGDGFVRAADADAQRYGFNQEQLEVAMRHHLWQVKWLFTPSNYRWWQRLVLAFYFLTGWGPK